MTKTKTNAEKIRTLRGRSRKDRQETVLSLRDLPGGNEAKAEREAKRKVIPSGIYTKVAQPVLQIERDDLLDQLWKAEKQAELWKDETKYSYTYHNKRSRSNAKSRHKTAMQEVFFNYIDSLKKRLISLDERISPIRHGC